MLRLGPKNEKDPNGDRPRDRLESRLLPPLPPPPMPGVERPLTLPLTLTLLLLAPPPPVLLLLPLLKKAPRDQAPPRGVDLPLEGFDEAVVVRAERGRDSDRDRCVEAGGRCKLRWDDEDGRLLS